MKVPKPSLILNSLVYQPPLPQLTADETERSLKYAEENGNVDTSKHSEKLTADVFRYAQPCGAHLPVSPKSGSTAAFFKTPVHMGRSIPGGATVGNTGSFRMKGLRTPRMVAPTLINLSFSQPNSPRTPRPHSRLATPVYMSTALSHRQSQENVLNTPCVAEALHVLQLAQDTGLPDFLTWIEDDKTGLSQVERQLLRNTDVELTDQNVVDYLLEMAQEEPGTAACSGSDAEAHFPPPPLLHPPPQLWHQPYSPPRLQSRDDPLPLLETDDGLNVRRKRRRRTYEKRMTSEEARVIRKQRATRAARAQQAADRDGPTRSLRWSETLPQQPPPVAAAAAAAAVVAEACSSDVAALSVTPPSSPVKPRSTPVRPRSPFMKRRSKRNRRQVARFEVHW